MPALVRAPPLRVEPGDLAAALRPRDRPREHRGTAQQGVEPGPVGDQGVEERDDLEGFARLRVECGELADQFLHARSVGKYALSLPTRAPHRHPPAEAARRRQGGGGVPGQGLHSVLKVERRARGKRVPPRRLSRADPGTLDAHQTYLPMRLRAAR